MLYLLSGASRAGKTLAAKKILAEWKIPYLSLDWIMMGFTNGIPEDGIHDKLFPDEIAVRLWPFLKAMLESMLSVDVDCVIEGEALLPELVAEFLEAHPGRVRICFLGYTDIDTAEKLEAIREFRAGPNDWLNKESDAYISRHVINMVEHSRKIQAGCARHNLRYFDTSRNFRETVDEAIRYLLEAAKDSPPGTDAG